MDRCVRRVADVAADAHRKVVEVEMERGRRDLELVRVGGARDRLVGAREQREGVVRRRAEEEPRARRREN